MAQERPSSTANIWLMSSESSQRVSNHSRRAAISASPVTRTFSSVLPLNPARVRLEEPTTAAPGSA